MTILLLVVVLIVKVCKRCTCMYLRKRSKKTWENIEILYLSDSVGKKMYKYKTNAQLTVPDDCDEFPSVPTISAIETTAT